MPKRAPLPIATDPQKLINDLNLSQTSKKALQELVSTLMPKVITVAIPIVVQSEFQDIDGWSFKVKKGKTYFIEGRLYPDVVDEDVSILLFDATLAASFGGHATWMQVDGESVHSVGYAGAGGVTDGTDSGYGVTCDAAASTDITVIDFTALVTATADGINQMRIASGNSGVGVKTGSFVNVVSLDRSTGTI